MKKLFDLLQTKKNSARQSARQKISMLNETETPPTTPLMPSLENNTFSSPTYIPPNEAAPNEAAPTYIPPNEAAPNGSLSSVNIKTKKIIREIISEAHELSYENISQAKKVLSAKDPDLNAQALDAIRPNWREAILIFAAAGLCESEIRVELCMVDSRFDPKIWSVLKERDEIIRDVFDQARAISEAWWLKFAREHLSHSRDTTVETGLVIFAMKNMFGWRDRNDGNFASDAFQGSVMSQLRARMTKTTLDLEAQGMSNVKKKPSRRGRKTDAERRQLLKNL